MQIAGDGAGEHALGERFLADIEGETARTVPDIEDFALDVRVYYEDTDSAGIVYYAIGYDQEPTCVTPGVIPAPPTTTDSEYTLCCRG